MTLIKAPVLDMQSSSTVPVAAQSLGSNRILESNRGFCTWTATIINCQSTASIAIGFDDGYHATPLLYRVREFVRFGTSRSPRVLAECQLTATLLTVAGGQLNARKGRAARLDYLAGFRVEQTFE